MMDTLGNRHAFVTGGGTGIGAAIAIALADAGATVTIAGRREEPLKDLAAKYPDTMRWRTLDVTSEEDIRRVMTESAEECGPIDILIANAGIAETATLAKMPLDLWRKVQQVNVEGVMLTMREVISGMAERGWGRIIVISSVAGLRGMRYGSAYAASKHAVLGLMKCAAEEVLMKGVTVNALCPAYVATPIVDRNVEKIMERSGLSHEEALASMRDTNPFGRLIEPEEVAAAALWLCGPGSGAVTSQAIAISGGQI